jgi:hypothetical protein
VIVVIFTEVIQVEGAIRVPQGVVNDLHVRNPHVNGRMVRLTRRLLDHPKVEAVELTDAYLNS